MATRAEIVAEIKGRVLAILPGAFDATGEAEAVEPKRLPAFAVVLAVQDAEPAAMGAPDAFLETGTLSVTVWQTGGPGIDATLRATADALTAAMLATPRDLGGLVEWIRPGDQDFDVARAERRAGRVDLTFPVFYLNRL